MAFRQQILTIVSAVGVFVFSGCEHPLAIDLDSELSAKKGGKGGGNEGVTPLMVTVVDVGGFSHDGNPTYTRGESGLDAAEIDHQGHFGLGNSIGFPDPDNRMFFVPPIPLTGGGTLDPGIVEALTTTLGCCDLRTMTSIFEFIEGEEEVVTTNPNYMRLRVHFLHDGVIHYLSYGSRICVPGNGFVPENDPQRGTRVEVTQEIEENTTTVQQGKKTKVVVTADTTWTIRSVGPAAVCGGELLDTEIVDIPLEFVAVSQ